MTFNEARFQKLEADLAALGLKVKQIPFDPDDPPLNFVTGKAYEGLNAVYLNAIRTLRGYSSNAWATFNQWNSLGGKVQRRPSTVRAGEWGVKIEFYPRRGKVRQCVLFNLDQIDGLAADMLDGFEMTPVQGIEFGKPYKDVALYLEPMPFR